MNQLPAFNPKAEEKIALFRSLFRGRTEVFPQRFESRKTGGAGYSPACSNEWVRGSVKKQESNVRIVLSLLKIHRACVYAAFLV